MTLRKLAASVIKLAASTREYGSEDHGQDGHLFRSTRQYRLKTPVTSILRQPRKIGQWTSFPAPNINIEMHYLLRILLILSFSLSGCASLWHTSTYVTKVNGSTSKPGPCGPAQFQNAIYVQVDGKPVEILIAKHRDVNWIGPILLPLIPLRSKYERLGISIIYARGENLHADAWKISARESIVPAVLVHSTETVEDKQIAEIEFEIPDLDKLEKFELLVPDSANQKIPFESFRGWHYFPLFAMNLNEASCASK